MFNWGCFGTRSPRRAADASTSMVHFRFGLQGIRLLYGDVMEMFGGCFEDVWGCLWRCLGDVLGHVLMIEDVLGMF